MADNRPNSRNKAPSKGTGHVGKRGSGTGHGQVGNTGGLHGGNMSFGNGPSSNMSGRRSQGSFNDTNSKRSQSGSFYGRSYGNGGSNGRKRLLPMLIILAVIFFFVMRGCGDDYISSDYYNQNTSSTSNTTSSTNAISGSSYYGTSLTNTGTGWLSSASNSYQDTSMSSADTTVDEAARDKYTVLKGDGNDSVTVMIYMCGADLESRSGMATRDLNEMVYATISDKVNVIVETGGAKKWQNSVISASTNQRWKVESGGLKALDKNVGSKQMTDPDTLVDFIDYAKTDYPADRYMLIFWDHGGGSVSGYGYDELYPNGTMTIDEISSALKQTGIKFDFVGFDACLMAGMETAIAVEPYADYLIASEETEPGTGWYYTNWLTSLSENTSIATIDLAKQLIDDFTSASASTSASSKTTLSIIDLAEFKGVIPSVLTSFGMSLSTQLASDNYQDVAKARSDTREFASSSHIDQVDLVNFCNNLGTDEAMELANAVKGCVKYNKTYNITNAYGMSIYFPYSSLKSVNSMVKIYENLDMDSAYSDSIKSFATLESSGQIVSSQSSQGTGIFDVLLGGNGMTSSSSSVDITSILMQALSGQISSGSSSYSGSSSGYGSILDYASLLGGSGLVNSDSIGSIASLLGARAMIGSDDLVLSEKDGQQVVSLSENQWSQMKSVGLNVFVDDGEGYIDLGIDNVASYNDDGDLIVAYDGSWMAINGQFVAFYISQDDYDEDTGYYYTLGYVPAELNGEYVNIIVEFSQDYEEGRILGAQLVYELSDGEISDCTTQGKGMIEIAEGDTIDFLCDYYGYDGTFKDSYYLNDESLIVDTDGLIIETLTMDNDDVYYSYRLTDYYNANYWTPINKFN